MKPTFRLIALCCVLAFFGYGQELQQKMLDVIPPSPMAHEITRFNAAQPNLYTGTAQINIPLYTIDFEGWQLPLSLNYYATGIQTNQEATEVGLGWALKSTGVISRVVKKNNDLAQTLYVKGYPFEQEDYLSKLRNFSSLSINERNSIADKMMQSTIDSAPDEFRYDFFGFAGSFILDKQDAEGKIAILKLTKDAVRIDFDVNQKNFTITTPTGFKGYFTIKERTTNLSGVAPNQGTNPDSDQLQYAGNLIDLQSIINRGAFRVITAWYLEKIQSPNGKELQFNYTIDSSGNSAYVSVTRPLISEGAENYKQEGGQKTYSFSRQVQEHVYQTSIVLPNALEISFQTENRADLETNFIHSDQFPGANSEVVPQRYTTINITGLHSASTFSKNIRLNQGYFNPTYLNNKSYPNEGYQRLRSRLEAIDIGDQTYRFTYHHGINGLPEKSTKGMDHFGYYNGKDHTSFLEGFKKDYRLAGEYQSCEIVQQLGVDALFYYPSASRAADADYGVAGLLSQVTYPTGGTTFYTYEPHRFMAKGAQSIATSLLPMAIDALGTPGEVEGGGFRLASIENRTAKGEVENKKSFQYINSRGASTGILLQPFIYSLPNLQLGDNCFYTFHNNFSLLGLNTAQGKRIGYSRVEQYFEEKNNLSFKQSFEFNNEPSKEFDVLQTTVDLTYVNGRLLDQFDTEGNSSVRHIEQLHNNTLVTAVNAVDYSVLDATNQFGTGYTFFTPRFYALAVANSEVSQRTTTEYLGTQQHTTIQSFVYNDLSQLKKTTVNSSDDASVITVEKRLLDYPDNGSALYAYAKQQNLVNTVLERIQYKGDKVIAATAYRYVLDQDNLVLREILTHDRSKGIFVESTTAFDFGPTYSSEMTFDVYDTEGRLLQATNRGGVSTAYIWGYNNHYPIVKAEGITHSALNTAHLEAENGDYENAIRTHQNTKNALVTTFAYNPLVGQTKVTQPNGVSTYFEYDSFNRLNAIKDQNQNVLQTHQYHYVGSAEPTTDAQGGMDENSEEDDETEASTADFVPNPNNPYSVSNMQNAFNALKAKNNAAKKTYSGKIYDEANQIETTNIYVRFWIENDEQHNHLLENELELSTIPLDYLYTDQEIETLEQANETSSELGRWLYTVVKEDYSFLPSIKHEILENLFLPESPYADQTSLKNAGIDQTFLFDLEDNSLELTGYVDDISASAKKSKTTPEGYLKLKNTLPTRSLQYEASSDPILDANGLFNLKNTGIVYNDIEPLVGVKVKTRRWFKWAKGWTDENGYYKVNRGYRRNPKYTIVFKNKEGFKIWPSMVSISSARYRAGRHSKEGFSRIFENNSVAWQWGTVNNATLKYFNYCDQLGITKPHDNLRIVAFSNTWGILNGYGTAPMLRRTFGSFTISKAIQFLMVFNFGIVNTAVSQFVLQKIVPDIIINANRSFRGTEDIYKTVFHELGHASHYRQVGNSYWGKYIDHVIASGGYGTGTETHAGYTGVGEMWGNYIGAVMNSMAFGTTVEDELNKTLNWFNPGFLYDAVNEIDDLTLEKAFFCLHGNTTSIEKLVAELKTKTQYDEKINEIYNRVLYNDWPTN